MTSRAAPRAAAPIPNWVDLPTLAHPQHVNEDGYEFEGPGLQEGAVNMNVEEEQEEIVEDQGEEVIVEEEPEVVDVDMEPSEPLLGIADSLVFVQSLRQSRQRHMQRLLPHIFTHPPLPSYNKPRARGPPKSTFIYPTPAPPTAPLPYREYHGPRKADASNSPNASAASPKPQTTKPEDGKSNSTARTQARAKRAAELDEVAPAHETECIARVTLTIGPFSYPETELWIGRFVEPRAEAVKVAKAEKKARIMTGELEAPKKRDKATPKPNGSTSNMLVPPRPPGMGMIARPMPRPPPGPSMRPSLPPIPPIARPAGAPPPRSPAPSDAAINPDLIKKVNLAASTRPWLSDIIHKAARKQASKEELALLGRTVGRLNKGEDVDTGESKVAGPSRNPLPSVAPSAIPAHVTADNATSRSDSPLTSEDGSESELSETEGEVNMRGKPQVGGGSGLPVHPPSAPISAASGFSSSRPPLSSDTGPPRPISPRVPNTYTPFRPSAVTPQQQTPRPYPASSVPPYNPMNSQPRPPSAQPYIPRPYMNSGPSTPHTPVTMPPPPPRPVYPRVPPFLFVAFKDAPNEKFLIPLGSNSYTSRSGGDYVTHPRPSLPPPAPPVSQVLPVDGPVQTMPIPPIEAPAQPVVAGIAGKLRTRASLGRSGKAPETPVTKVEPATIKAESPMPDAEAPPPPKAPIRPPPPPPKPGTVTISLMMPTSEWEMPDWTKLEKDLPWFNKPPIQPIPATDIPPSPSPLASGGTPLPPHFNTTQSSFPGPSTSTSTPQPPSTQPRILPWSPILNLGAVDFTPEEGNLQPTTIHLAGLDDQAWFRIKQVIDVVETTEISVLERKEPDLLTVMEPSVVSSPLSETQPGKPPLTHGQQQVRQAYFERKKSRFNQLLSRAPTRSFLRIRTETVDPVLIDATTDKWAPRHYNITTKALYSRSPPPDDEAEPNPYSPEKPAKKRKSNVAEPAVAFEMPVSLDALDEMVEEGAKFAIGRKKPGRKKGDGKKEGTVRKPRASAAEGSKRGGSRSKSGAVCEGCAQAGLKVWRRGPGGKGTLCKDCGDAFNAGTLGELKAPGAVKIEERSEVGTEGTREAGDGVLSRQDPPTATTTDEIPETGIPHQSSEPPLAPPVFSGAAETQKAMEVDPSL